MGCADRRCYGSRRHCRIHRLTRLAHQLESPIAVGSQGDLLDRRAAVAEFERLVPAQLAVAAPAPKRGKHLGGIALTHSVGQHDPWCVALLAPRDAARGPEIVHQQGLQLLAAIDPWHHLGLVPALGLGVPLALPQQAVVLQEGMGGAVGVVDELKAAGVSHR